jgi:hypothetical protein
MHQDGAERRPGASMVAAGQSDEELDFVDVSLELDFDSEPDSAFDSDFESPSFAVFAAPFFA